MPKTKPTTKPTVMIVRDQAAIRRALFDAGRTSTPVEIAVVGGTAHLTGPILDLPRQSEWPPHVTLRGATASESAMAGGKPEGFGMHSDPEVLKGQLGKTYVY